MTELNAKREEPTGLVFDRADGDLPNTPEDAATTDDAAKAPDEAANDVPTTARDMELELEVEVEPDVDPDPDPELLLD